MKRTAPSDVHMKVLRALANSTGPVKSAGPPACSRASYAEAREGARMECEGDEGPRVLVHYRQGSRFAHSISASVRILRHPARSANRLAH
jgi:hypothetical protein